MVELGFTVTQCDKTVFYNISKIKVSNYIIIEAATDDFTIITDSKVTTNSFLNRLEYHIKLVCLKSIS